MIVRGRQLCKKPRGNRRTMRQRALGRILPRNKWDWWLITGRSFTICLKEVELKKSTLKNQPRKQQKRAIILPGKGLNAIKRKKEQQQHRLE